MKNVCLIPLFLISACTATTIEKRFSPSFSCTEVDTKSIEALICAEKALCEFDKQLAETYRESLKKTDNPTLLKAEQRGWIKGRDNCWKSENEQQCIADAYQYRIAELQALYLFSPHSGPFDYICNNDPQQKVRAAFYPTEPPTLIAERNGEKILMYNMPSGSGARYEGRNAGLWEHQGSIILHWGVDAIEEECRVAP